MNFVWSVKSFRCYLQACKCQYFFPGPLLSTMHLVWSELIERNIIQIFSDEKCILALSLSYQSRRYRGRLQWLRVFGLEHSGVFYACSSYFEPSSEFVLFHRIVPAQFLRLDIDAFIWSAILSA